MDTFYFLIRAGLILAVLSVGMYLLGKVVGRLIWGGPQNVDSNN